VLLPNGISTVFGPVSARQNDRGMVSSTWEGSIVSWRWFSFHCYQNSDAWCLGIQSFVACFNI
jgi:hypothetical protein